MPLVSIVTPSFNKYDYVCDAIDSVLAQTFNNFEYWIVENSTDKKTRHRVHHHSKDHRIQIIDHDFTNEERQLFYPTTLILNQVYPLVNGKYIIFLSDDDILFPRCLEISVRFLEENPDIHVCYHTQALHILKSSGKTEYHSGILVGDVIGGPGGKSVNCIVDGGQIMHRKSCLDHIDQPYFPEDIGNAGSSDGIFMDKLAAIWPFHPVPHQPPLSAHRRTPVSTWIRS